MGLGIGAGSVAAPARGGKTAGGAAPKGRVAAAARPPPPSDDPYGFDVVADDPPAKGRAGAGDKGGKGGAAKDKGGKTKCVRPRSGGGRRCCAPANVHPPRAGRPCAGGAPATTSTRTRSHCPMTTMMRVPRPRRESRPCWGRLRSRSPLRLRSRAPLLLRQGRRQGGRPRQGRRLGGRPRRPPSPRPRLRCLGACCLAAVSCCPRRETSSQHARVAGLAAAAAVAAAAPAVARCPRARGAGS